MTDNLEALMTSLSGKSQSSDSIKQILADLTCKSSVETEKLSPSTPKAQFLKRNIDIISSVKPLLSGNNLYKADIIIKFFEISILYDIIKNNPNN